MNKTIFQQTYSGESLSDIDRDVSEAVNAQYNEAMADIPTDEHGFQQGTFTVTIEWKPE